MNKKYQFFISSTYEDLKEERDVVIHAILTMSHFPIGMEMFSAANEEQWQIIKEAIDSSDYYVLIVANKYGSIIETGDDVGISYTEKEFNYAVEKGIPILAFIINNEKTMIAPTKMEANGKKMEQLKEFKEKIKKSGKYVSFWNNKDHLEALISQSIAKAILKNDRPGWVRTTEFDIEKNNEEIQKLTERVHTLESLNTDLKLENDRKPNLYISCIRDTTSCEDENNVNCNDVSIETDGSIHFSVLPVYMGDAEEGIEYKDYIGKAVHVSANEVRLFRYVCKNAFSVVFRLCNGGNAKATGARVRMKFAKELMVISQSALDEYIYPKFPSFSKQGYEGWDSRFFEPEIKDEIRSESVSNQKFVSKEELVGVDDIANLMGPDSFDKAVTIFPDEIRVEFAEVKHKGLEWFRGAYILPTVAGEFEIECEIICNEYADIDIQKIKVIIV